MAAPLPTTATLSPDMSAASPWASSLPEDLVRLVASRLLAGDLLDYVRFRAVCAPWRSSTASPRGRGVVDPRFHPRRWMMLSEGGGLYPGHPKLQGYVRFFNLDTGAFVRVHMPLFEDHCVLDSFNGLLVLQRDDDTAIRLLHPFTGDILDLPPLKTLLPQMHEVFPHLSSRKKLPYLRSISTAATFADDGVVTVMLALRTTRRVAVATSQDHQWTMSTWNYVINFAPFPYQSKIYVVYNLEFDHSAKIFQIDTPLPGEVLQPPKLIVKCTADKLRVPVFLVECDSEVLVIGHSKDLASKLLVYKLADLVMENTISNSSSNRGSASSSISGGSSSIGDRGSVGNSIGDNELYPGEVDPQAATKAGAAAASLLVEVVQAVQVAPVQSPQQLATPQAEIGAPATLGTSIVPFQQSSAEQPTEEQDAPNNSLFSFAVTLSDDEEVASRQVTLSSITDDVRAKLESIRILLQQDIG
ncbi:uncharacterized protein LOC111258439 [Setaria italica]|uniref:uncharacterized protein LOC111258439 n=1 Tax=Setaria italica TaxID=4555 RepID=UPI000BE5BA25|nr:uncharacterized protein LOC111258439 [Setaria italica]